MTSEIINESAAIRDEGVEDRLRPRGPSRKESRLRRLLTKKFIIGAGIVAVISLFGIFGPFLTQDPRAISNIGLAPPSSEHFLGTTQIGADVFSQLAYATRGSLIVGVSVAALTLFLSAFFGILGAYIGGVVDEAFTLFTNVMLVIPGLPLVIVIASYIQNKSVFLVIVVLALTGWPAGARVLRSQTLSVRNRDYVLGARVSGEKTWRVISVEILPNLLPVMSSGFVFATLGAILAEAGLSFVGIGATGALTWGTMLADASSGQALLFGAWWWFAPPGLLIAILGAGLSLINFSLDEVINPRLRVHKMPKVEKKAKTA